MIGFSVSGGRCAGAAALVAALALGAAPLAGQGGSPRELSLPEALQSAAGKSEQVAIARAGVARARGDVLRARAARLPQVGATASYQRTLASQFEGLGGSGPDTVPAPPPYCRGDFTSDPTLPLEQRVGELERRLGCPPGSPFGGLDFGNLGFGAENTYNLGVSVFWPAFTGGRLPAQARIADAAREMAELGVASAEAQLRLDVTQAYFDAQLADQLVRIAEAQAAQAAETLRLAELGYRVGQQAEFDVLRARVARDNLAPVLIQRRTQRALAYDRLRLLLDLPLDQELALTTPLEDAVAAPDMVAADTLAARRIPVLQADELVEVQVAQLRIARSQRLPSLSLSSQYGQVGFQSSLLPELDRFRDNWTVSAVVQVPLFTGGRTRGDVVSARAGVAQARAQLQQARELALLDTRSALAQLSAARATAQASAGTVEQAERAYGIAELRYREGLSTLLELADTRLLLAQARATRASALRDLQVARTRVALLPYLPVATPGGVAPGAGAGVPNGAGSSRAAEAQPPAQPAGPSF